MRKKILEVLKSGDFTLYYHDNGYCSLYPGKIKPSQMDEENKNYVNPIYEFNGCTNDYTPEEVSYLVKALNGKVNSI